MPKRANWRVVKRHRSYTVDEAARCLNASKGTLRRWIKDGLPALTDQRPLLILGGDLTDYLQSKKRVKQKCKPDECYCFSCREPRRPAFDEFEYYPSNSKTGNLRGLCEACSTVMNKRISLSGLTQLSNLVTVTHVENCQSTQQGSSPHNNGH